MAVMTAGDILSRHYLEIRCGLLDIAAALDRIERADGADDVRTDPRLEEIRHGIEILAGSGSDRAERIQLLFSDEYISGWNKAAKA